MPSDMFSYVKKVLNNAADTPKTTARRRMERPERQRQSKLNSEVLRERYGIKEPLEVVRYNQKDHGLDKLKATISTGFQQATETVNKLSNQPSSSTSTKQNWKSTSNKEDPNTLTPNETPSTSRRRPSFEMAAAAALAAFRGENAVNTLDQAEASSTNNNSNATNNNNEGSVQPSTSSNNDASAEDVPRKGFNEAEAASMASSSAEDNRCKVCFKTLQETEFFRVCTVCIKRVCEDCSATYKNNSELSQVSNWTCSICIRRRANREKGKGPTNSYLKAQQQQVDKKKQDEYTSVQPFVKAAKTISLDEEAPNQKGPSGGGGLAVPVNNARRHSTGNAVADAINAVAAAAAQKGKVDTKISSKLMVKDGSTKMIRRPSSAALTAGIVHPKGPQQQLQQQPQQQQRSSGRQIYNNPGVVVTNHDEDKGQVKGALHKKSSLSARSMLAHAQSDSQLAPHHHMKRRSSVAILATGSLPHREGKPVLGRTISDKSMRVDTSVLLGSNNNRENCTRKSELSAPSSNFRRHSGGTIGQEAVQRERRRKSSLQRSQSSEESSEDLNIGYMPYFSGSVARLHDDENTSFTVGSSTSSISQDIARELDLLAIRGKEERRSSFESAVSDSAALGVNHHEVKRGPDVELHDEGARRRYCSLERSKHRQNSSSITKGGADHVRIVVDDYGDHNIRNDPSMQNTATITLYQTPHDPYGFGLRVVGAPFQNSRKNELVVARVLWLCPGGPAQRAGIQVGDKILKWGGTSLNSISIDRVPQIIEQCQDTKVTLIVASGSSGSEEINTSNEGNGSRRRLPVLPSSSRRSSSTTQLMNNPPPQRSNIDYGQIQMTILYDNKQLNVTLWSAENLQGIESSTGYSLPKPYATVRLCVFGRNRIFTTEVDSGNQHPVWSANHVFTNVEENDFMASELEIMVWNYSNSQNHECLGKLVLESASLLNVNNQVQWYPLQNPNGYGRYDTHQSVQNKQSQQQQQISIHTDDYSSVRQDQSSMDLAYQTRQSYHQREPYSFQEFIPPVSSVQSSYTTRNPNIYSSNSSSCLYRKPYHIASPPKIPYTFPSRKSSSSILGSDILSNYYNTNSPSSSFHLNTHQRVSIQSRSCPQSRRTSAEYSQGSMTMISSRSSALLNDAISYSNLYSSIGSLRRRGSSNSSSKESLKTSQRRNNSACLLPVSSGRLHGRRKSDCGNRSIPIDTLGLDPKVRRNSSLDRGGDQDPYSGGSYNYDNNSRRNSRLY
ncbi:uncharacterized protein [Lepeophtheirus salmonis]|uniref:uncharacterized protein isoform X2 n=1 Tax=Lepeophtheirus salmonis TaxID=72036 RepID=UPI001AE66C4E|nr:uncharacterized protein LOC121118611 isoform X2 [Lepeophtheirus salmonis]